MLSVVKNINSILWGNFLIVFLLGVGIYFSIQFKFIQVFEFKNSIKNLFLKEKDEKMGITSFQALATAVAAQVGTGNLAGAATAIASGGPGAIFWMWISAFFGMSTIYVEATLSQIFKRKNNGDILGGPAYYIEKSVKNRLISKGMAIFFSVACILALGLMGNAVQSNSIGVAFNKAFGVDPAIMGIIISILCGIIFFGGIKRIAKITEKVVPIMAITYIIICFTIILLEYREILNVLKIIFKSAFSIKSIEGGIVGVSVKEAVRYGVARGLFSNEAGMGSTPHAHAIARVKKPTDQGLVAILTVFIDTFVVLTLTAIVILISKIDFNNYSGIEITQIAFSNSLGTFGEKFIAIALLFFAFSTILGWYFFGEVNVYYLFKTKKSVNLYRGAVMIMIVIGTLFKVETIWELADFFNALMVIPNLIALIFLYKKIKRGVL